MACGTQSVLYAESGFGTAGGRITPLYNLVFSSLFGRSHRADMYFQRRDPSPPPAQPHCHGRRLGDRSNTMVSCLYEI